MTAPIRVVVAEDSNTVRHLLVSLLAADPAVEVVGEALDGRQALALTHRLRPSVVVMDIRMPVMDGFEATKRIMMEVPTPVVIVTAAAESEVGLSLQAVELGALALVRKPNGLDGVDVDGRAGRLVSLVKALSDVKVIRRHRREEAPAHCGGPDAGVMPPGHIEVVAVAASTGGPAALHRLLERLPAATDVPLLAVQHIADGFTPGLVSWLESGTRLRVKVAEHGEPLQGGTVYLAPERRHLEVTSRRTVRHSDAPPVGGFRPSATVLFESVACVYGPAVAAVVLTGMGRDGLDGIVRVRKAGGRVLAQDEESSVVFGMPGVVVEAGLADVVGPVDVLADRLSRFVVTRWS